MYARVTHCPVEHSKLEEFICLVREVSFPEAKRQPGFKNAYLLTDDVTGISIIITLWETEADLKASETGGFLREQIARSAPLLVALPIRETFEVKTCAL
jgi:heme-degrading monooxygenase HmoA